MNIKENFIKQLGEFEKMCGPTSAETIQNVNGMADDILRYVVRRKWGKEDIISCLKLIYCTGYAEAMKKVSEEAKKLKNKIH